MNLFKFKNPIVKLIMKIRVFYLKRKLDNIQKTLSQLGVLIHFKLSTIYISKYGVEKLSYCLKLSLITCNKLLYEVVLEEHQEIYEKEKNKIEEVIISIGENQEMKQFISDYNLIRSFYYDIGMNQVLSNICFERSLKYCENIKKLTYDSFIEKSNEIKKKYKIGRKQFWKLRDKIVSSETFSKISKIEISTQNITYLFGMLTTIFVLTGFIYNKYFLGFFGIDVSRFFTIGDYLSTSIDKIYITCISVIIGIIFYILGIYDGFKTEIRNELLEISQQKDPNILPFVLGTIMLSIGTVILFYRDVPGKYTELSLLIFIVLMYFYHKLQIKYYFVKPINLSIFVVSILWFSINIFSSIMNDKDKIDRMNISDLREYIFTYDKGVKFNDSSWVLLSGNSGYFFFYDKEQHKSIIIPRTLVKSIESVKK